MARIKAKLSDFTVPEAVIIRAMEVDKENAEDFDIDREKNIGVAISRIKKEFPGRDYTKAPNEESTKILVWRIA